MLSVVMLNVVMPSVIMLNVVMLRVVAPNKLVHFEIQIAWEQRTVQLILLDP
jgi:hypothetical protein